jgi:hypothetical protein
VSLQESFCPKIDTTYHEDHADLLSVAKLYASDYGKRTVEKEGFVALLR